MSPAPHISPPRQLIPLPCRPSGVIPKLTYGEQRGLMKCVLTSDSPPSLENQMTRLDRANARASQTPIACCVDIGPYACCEHTHKTGVSNPLTLLASLPRPLRRPGNESILTRLLEDSLTCLYRSFRSIRSSRGRLDRGRGRQEFTPPVDN